VKPKPHVAKSQMLPARCSSASKIRQLREEAGYTQEELAHLARMSVTRLGRLENGDPAGRNPGIQALLSLAVVLGCRSVEEVIEDWMWPPEPQKPDVIMRLKRGQD
jgi:transcriptional regulator with XRE-family HTH domain